MSEINISIFEGTNLLVFVISIGLAFVIRAIVMKIEKDNNLKSWEE